MLDMLEITCPELPDNKPRYLMDVGTPDDIREVGGARHRHVRLRHADPRRPPGLAYTRRGKVNLRNAGNADDPRPLDEESDCPAAPGLPRALTCTIWCARKRRWGRCSSPGTICPTIRS